MIKLFVVDDDNDFVAALSGAIGAQFKVQAAQSLSEAKQLFAPFQYDAALLDIRLKKTHLDKEGLEILKMIKEREPDLPVLMMTAYSDVDIAVESLKLGAEDFIQKNKVNLEEFRIILTSLLKTGRLKKRVSGLESKLKKLDPWEIVGKDPAIEQVRTQIKLVAENGKVNVLIKGETGTGKELVAKAIHREGVRKEEPYVIVSLSALNKETIASDLFGHEKGAYTGAESQRIGFIEESNKGILFLDEIGELDADIQVKLLRVIETREFHRLGSNKTIRSDVQWIMATHQNLEELLKTGKFREDLYYRLKTFQIDLPPLRGRKTDISLLAQHFLQLFREQQGSEVKEISDEVLKIFNEYHWPGNIRELKQVIEYSLLKTRLSGGKVIKPEHLPNEISGIGEKHLKKEEVSFPVDMSKRLAEVELAYISEALEKTRKKTEVYALLGYKNRFTLLRKVKTILQKYPELKNFFPVIEKFFVTH